MKRKVVSMTVGQEFFKKFEMKRKKFLLETGLRKISQPNFTNILAKHTKFKFEGNVKKTRKKSRG